MPSYNSGKAEILAQALSSSTGLALRSLLVKTGFVFDPDDASVADIVANEVSGGSYARQVRSGNVVVEDDANDRAAIDSDNNTYSAVPDQGGGDQILGEVTYHEGGGTDATRVLIDYNPAATPITGNGSDVEAQVDATGLVRLTHV